MTTAILQKMSFAEFLNYNDGTETFYELENGVLIPMPSESDLNQRIAIFLLVYLGQIGIPTDRLRVKAEVAVYGLQVGVRVPDLVMYSEDLARAMQDAKRSLVTLEMPAPLLVVEIVSPNQATRDYRYKRSEYAARGILEYWIVDPIAQKVTVLVWIEGFYDAFVYVGNDRISSSLFPNLNLTAAQILQA